MHTAPIRPHANSGLAIANLIAAAMALGGTLRIAVPGSRQRTLTAAVNTTGSPPRTFLATYRNAALLRYRSFSLRACPSSSGPTTNADIRARAYARAQEGARGA